MNALFTLKSAINRSTIAAMIALVTIAPMAYPKMVLASQLQTKGQDQPVVFEIKDLTVLTPKQNIHNSNTFLSYHEAISNDPYVIKLTAYLQKHNSPMAQYAPQIIQQPQWQRALAISWVESN